MRNKIKLIFSAIFLLSALTGIYLIFNTLTCQRLKCLILKDNSQYKIKETYEDNKYIFRGIYENGNMLLRAEIRPNSSLDEANQAIQARLAQTKGLFEDAAAPYPGEISDVISCGQEYKPVYSKKQQNGIQISYFSGFVNDRLVFGSCVSDQAAYHDTLTMFYCEKQKKFYQLEIIIPHKDFVANLEENDKILSSIGCK